jgi:hypothetical protein
MEVRGAVSIWKSKRREKYLDLVAEYNTVPKGLRRAVEQGSVPVVICHQQSARIGPLSYQGVHIEAGPPVGVVFGCRGWWDRGESVVPVLNALFMRLRRGIGGLQSGWLSATDIRSPRQSSG